MSMVTSNNSPSVRTVRTTSSKMLLNPKSCLVLTVLAVFLYSLPAQVTAKATTKTEHKWNIEVLLYTGREYDGTKLTLIQSNDDLKEAYRVIVVNKNLSELGTGAFRDLNRLDKLLIQRSGLKTIQPGAFSGDLSSLRVLNLAHNQIKEIKSNVIAGLPLSTLHLYSNSISHIEGNAFDDMSNLRAVYLSDNELTKYDPKWFAKCSLLYRLDFKWNMITSLPMDMLANFRRDIEDLSETDMSLELWFDDNKIKSIDAKAFTGITRIGHIWLSNNEIEEIKPGTFKGIKIKQLLLDGNKLQCIDQKVRSELNILDTLNVDSPEMDCDCLRATRTWANTSNLFIESNQRTLACMKQKIDEPTS